MKGYLIGGTLVSLAMPAFAQQPPPSAAAASAQPAAQDGDGIEDVIVTAQKREENLQSVPISIAALSSATLARTGANTLDSVQRLVPGLTMSAIGSGFVSYTYIRGAGTNQIDAGADPSVAYFVDEVYIGGTTGLQFDLFDIERIEILKGPQGTLFGRNAAAGAVSVTTKRPSATPTAQAQLEIGDYGQALARASLSGPLTSDGALRYRFTSAVRHRDAFTNNPVGRDPGYVNNVGVRGAIEYDRDALNLLVSGEYFRSSNGMTNQFLATANPLGFISPAAAARLPTDQSFFRRYYSFDGFERQKLGDITGRLQYDFGGDITLTAISAYRNNLFNRRQDQDGSAANGYVLSTRELTRQFSQEFRLSNGAAARLKWIVGLYYFDSHIDRLDTIATGPDFATAAIRNRFGSDDHNLYTKSYAAFGQLSYGLTDRLGLTLGARYTRDDKESHRTVDRYQLPGSDNFYSIDPHKSFESFDPAVTIDYKAMDGVLLYGSYKHGFKSGGWQSLLPLRSFAVNAYDPEHVRAWEAGIKSDLLDNRLRLNIAGFYQVMKDQQVLRIPAPAQTITDNAGETEAYGADIAISAAPSRRLRIDLNTTIQHARFTRYDSLGQNFVGNNQLRSPDFSGNVTVEYRAPLGAFGDLAFRGDYFRQSKIFFDAANTSTANAFQPAYGVANARVALQPASKAWELAAWVKNLTDERYFRNIAIVGPSGVGAPGDPLTFGATLNLNFQ